MALPINILTPLAKIAESGFGVAETQLRETAREVQEYNERFPQFLENYWEDTEAEAAKESLQQVQEMLPIGKVTFEFVKSVERSTGGSKAFAEMLRAFEQLQKNYQLLANVLWVLAEMPPAAAEEFPAFVASLSKLELPDFVKEDLGMGMLMREQEQTTKETIDFDTLKLLLTSS